MKRLFYIFCFLILCLLAPINSNGQYWEKINTAGLPEENVYKIRLTQSNTIIVDSYDLKQYYRYYSRDFGSSWTLVNDSILNGILFFGENDDIYSVVNRQIYVSYDDGITFSKKGKPIPDSSMFHRGIYIAAISPSGLFIAFEEKDMYISYDDGMSWSHLRDYWWQEVYRIRFDSLDNIYFSNLDLFWCSTNKGKDWVRYFHAADYGYEFAIHPNTNLFIHQYSVFKSTNQGNSWDTLARFRDNGGCFLDINKSGIIFADDYHSTDIGKTWINNGQMGMLAYNDENTILQKRYCQLGGFEWPELYKFTNYVSSTDNSDEDNSPSISPNPAKDFIEVQINEETLREGSEPDIKIYNVLGEKYMDSRLRGNDIVGNGNDMFEMHGDRCRINISILPKGVYFIKTGNQFSKFVKI